jgi:succinate dehydrogenase/fumarate reductase flavoprotein subunit
MIEEIPGFGALVALARSADTAVKAGLKVADATSEVVEASSDAVKDTIDKLEEIKEEKLQEPQQQPIQQQFGGQKEYNKKNAIKQSIMKHVGGAIKEFRDSTMNPYKIINRPSIYTRKRKNKNKLRRTKKRI